MTNQINMPDKICYKRNFLDEVIVRLDFLTPIDELRELLPKNIRKRITPTRLFPIAEPRNVIEKRLKITQDTVNSEDIKSMEWNFYSTDKSKQLTITPGFYFISYKKYSSYQDLKKDFLLVLPTLHGKYQNLQFSRIGLRYINNIQFPSGDPLSWDEYLEKKLLNTISYYKEMNALARAFQSLEYNFGDYNLRFQFGILNPDYPAVIRRKTFILDLDAYYSGILDREDVSSTLDKFHSRIQELFEKSITNNLREIMNEVNSNE